MSDTLGVGNLFRVEPDDPASLSLMWAVGEEVNTNHKRPAGVADCLQRSEHGVSASSSEISAVLKSEPTRAALSDKSDGFKEEARPFAFDSAAFRVGAGDVLTGRTSDEDVGQSSEVGKNSFFREGSNVIVNQNPRIVLCVKCAPPGYILASRKCLESGPVHSERPSAGCRTEKIKHLHPCLLKSTGARS